MPKCIRFLWKGSETVEECDRNMQLGRHIGLYRRMCRGVTFGPYSSINKTPILIYDSAIMIAAVLLDRIKAFTFDA